MSADEGFNELQKVLKQKTSLIKMCDEIWADNENFVKKAEVDNNMILMVALSALKGKCDENLFDIKSLEQAIITIEEKGKKL